MANWKFCHDGDIAKYEHARIMPKDKAIDNHKSWPIEKKFMKETLQNMNVFALCPRTKAIDNHKSWLIENFFMKETLKIWMCLQS